MTDQSEINHQVIIIRISQYYYFTFTMPSQIRIFFFYLSLLFTQNARFSLTPSVLFFSHYNTHTHTYAHVTHLVWPRKRLVSVSFFGTNHFSLEWPNGRRRYITACSLSRVLCVCVYMWARVKRKYARV